MSILIVGHTGDDTQGIWLLFGISFCYVKEKYNPAMSLENKFLILDEYQSPVSVSIYCYL